MKQKLLLLTVFATIFFHTTMAQDTKSGFVPAGNLQVYYEVTGEGAPALLLHAGYQDLHMWDGVVRKLSKKFTIIRIDLPGHGLTTGVDHTIPVSDVIYKVLSQLKSGPVNLGGISLGSIVAEEFAIAHPELVKTLALMSPGLNGLDKIKKADSLSMSWYPAMQASIAANDTARAATIFADAWATGPARVKGQVKGSAYEYVYNSTLRNMRLHPVGSGPNFPDGATSIRRISEIKVPVLIVDGDKDLPYIVTSAFYLQGKLPQAQRVTIHNAAHMFPLENPEKTEDILKDFWK